MKLWKHHAAQAEADQINAMARQMEEGWLERYGGKISSEWFFAKTLQILHEAPLIYAAADRLIEAADWVAWQLTGVETRNGCTAGYKAIWSKRDGFPRREYFAALHPNLANVVEEKLSRRIMPVGTRAGELTEQAAGWTGLKPGTAVAVANVVDVVPTASPLPKLPVARALWMPRPNLKTAAAAWIYAGGAHHTSFSYALTADHLRDFCSIAGIEFLLIDERTCVEEFLDKLRWNELYYLLAKGI